MWAQRSDRQPMLQQITPDRAVLLGYMEWFNANGKPFIMTREARARVLRVPRPERPRQQRGPRPTGASTGTAQQTAGPYTSAGAGVDAGGPFAEPYTPMPPFFSHTSMPQLFSHASSSQFQPQFTFMPPPTEGFFAGAFQPYSSMMAAPSHSPGHFYPPPLSVYPLQGPTFGSSYGMVHQTPPGSLFATGPSGSGHHADDNADESEEDDDDTEPLVRRNPPRHRRAPDCGTGGHRRH
ncbi:hypothetical protein V6N13_127472 [Hibiscus sabdariffa]